MQQHARRVSRVSFRDEHPSLGDGRQEILAGLGKEQKTLNPMWLYDQRGSELFDQITRLPEYYPTRTEVEILRRNRDAISQRCGDGCLFIEPGSGSSEKVRILLDALRPLAYVPIDISADFLQQSAEALSVEYPWLTIHAVCADFNGGWHFIEEAKELEEGKRVVFYPGSTIGNLEPQAARQFLGGLRELVGKSGGVLLGVDTHKSSERLNAAYNDSAGVTASFNLNILSRLNELLDAEFSEENFRHRAFYNEAIRRIEMHLVSTQSHSVPWSGGSFNFAKGETIHTENSYKYSQESFAELARTAGLSIVDTWADDEDLFSVHYLAAG